MKDEEYTRLRAFSKFQIDLVKKKLDEMDVVDAFVKQSKKKSKSKERDASPPRPAPVPAKAVPKRTKRDPAQPPKVRNAFIWWNSDPKEQALKPKFDDLPKSERKAALTAYSKKRWAELKKNDPHQIERYTQLAVADKDRYDRDMELFKQGKYHPPAKGESMKMPVVVQAKSSSYMSSSSSSSSST
jgi:hypothetical protein